MINIKSVFSKVLPGFIASAAFTSTEEKKVLSNEPQNKPIEVIVVPTKSTKAAVLRDLVAAGLLIGFAGLTINDRFINPKQIGDLDHLTRIIKNFDTNQDGHLSKEELDTMFEFISKVKKN